MNDEPIIITADDMDWDPDSVTEWCDGNEYTVGELFGTGWEFVR